MMLTDHELRELIFRVFPRLPDDRRLAILVDLPHQPSEDNPDWRKRREIAFSWIQHLTTGLRGSYLESVHLFVYPHVAVNNADLPDSAFQVIDELPDDSASAQKQLKSIPFERIYQKYQLILAPTELSCTAPLKVAAKHYGFRAATMPGFSEEMIPALRIDYEQVNDRVVLIQSLLSEAHLARVRFNVNDQIETVLFDLRQRKAHASTGRFPEPGTAGNLPSGEAYIVPYEGENEPSLTYGNIPVQFDDEIVWYRVENNRAVKVLSQGPKSRSEAELLAREPAYGNIAELGFGVLDDFGLKPIGEILLDEKLGFHVAFGRSDHFGGIISPRQFTVPQASVHIDRIYLPEIQPGIILEEVVLEKESGPSTQILKNGRYVLFGNLT